MAKNDQETQRIIVGASKSTMETQKLTAVPIKKEPNSQETQRIQTVEAQSPVSVSLSAQEVKDIPFGTLKLDFDGKILRYNPFANPSGPTPSSIQGKSFFSEVIPFDAIKSFAARYQTAVKNRELYEEFKFHITVENTRPFDIHITLYYSKSSDSFWALINRGPSAT